MEGKTIQQQQPILAAIYARVSSEQQAQQSTIDSQVEVLRERVQADGLMLDDELCFIDDGYSGSTLVRPALERLRDIAWAGGFQRLYVHSPDRLARKYAWQVLLLEELGRSGIELVFLNRSIGVSPEEDLLLQMQGMIAEYERSKIMERSRRGKRHAAKCGSISVLTAAPYGYRYITKHAGGGQAHYQMTLEEARIVKQIFEWVGVDRASVREVCRRLQKQNVPSPKGKSCWAQAVVAKLLKNPAYKGLAIFGRTRSEARRPRLRTPYGKPEHPRYAMSRCRGPSEEQIAIPVPAIVNEELFAAVAEQMVENRRRARRHKSGAGYLLQGILECGICGRAFYGKGITRYAKNNNAPYPYYRCLGRDGYRFGGPPICQCKPVRLDRLDAAIWADVCSFLQNPDDLQREFERRLSGETETDVNLKQIQKQITTTQRSISRLIDAYEEGLLQKSEFEPRVRQARERLERLQHETSVAQDRAAQREELRLVLGRLDDFAAHVRQGLAQADMNTRREIIRSLVKVIKIDDEQVRITYRVSPRPFENGPSRGQIRQHCRNRVRGHHPGVARKEKESPFTKADRGKFAATPGKESKTMRTSVLEREVRFS